MDEHDLIDSQEMYLRTVLELEEEGIPALRARLVERLNLSAPSVSEGVNRMIDDGLMVLNDDRTVGLTAKGRHRANRVMRKHRIAEVLLVDVLDVAHEFVHEEACRWEHVISDRVEGKLFEFLGQPTVSPYGNPIPGVEELEEVGFALLTLAKSTGDRVRLERISERLQSRHDVMHTMTEVGIHAGCELRVNREGPKLEITGPDGAMTLDDDAARLLYVSEQTE